MSNNKNTPFVFADSTLLEVLEELMEDPAQNLKTFTEMHKAFSGLVASGQATEQMASTCQKILRLLVELREFDIRCQEIVLRHQQG